MMEFGAFEGLVYDNLVARWVAAMVRDYESELLPELPQGARVLDVGCGGGHMALGLAARRRDLQVTGIDIDVRQIARARTRVRDASAYVEFLIASAMDLPYDDKSFDAVYSLFSLKHWPDRMTGIQEMLRVLRPGGKLLLVELDRSASQADVLRAVSRFGPFANIAAAGFRLRVISHSVDLEGLELLAKQSKMKQKKVGRVRNQPAIFMRGTR